MGGNRLLTVIFPRSWKDLSENIKNSGESEKGEVYQDELWLLENNERQMKVNITKKDGVITGVRCVKQPVSSDFVNAYEP